MRRDLGKEIESLCQDGGKQSQNLFDSNKDVKI